MCVNVMIKATIFINNRYKVVAFNFKIAIMKVANFHSCNRQTALGNLVSYQHMWRPVNTQNHPESNLPHLIPHAARYIFL